MVHCLQVEVAAFGKTFANTTETIPWISLYQLQSCLTQLVSSSSFPFSCSPLAPSCSELSDPSLTFRHATSYHAPRPSPASRVSPVQQSPATTRNTPFLDVRKKRLGRKAPPPQDLSRKAPSNIDFCIVLLEEMRAQIDTTVKSSGTHSGGPSFFPRHFFCTYYCSSALDWCKI